MDVNKANAINPLGHDGPKKERKPGSEEEKQEENKDADGQEAEESPWAGAEAFAVGRRNVPHAVRISLSSVPHRAQVEEALEIIADLLEGCLPSFGGAYLRRVWHLLDEAVGLGLPMTLSVAGFAIALFAWHIDWSQNARHFSAVFLFASIAAIAYYEFWNPINRPR